MSKVIDRIFGYLLILGPVGTPSELVMWTQQ